MAIRNPAFVTHDASSRPGEATDWTWSVHSADTVAWATFNAWIGLEPWMQEIEQFEAGHQLEWTWAYPTATERLAATGFTSADLLGVARQEDDRSLWILVGVSPTLWRALETGGNEGWWETWGAVPYAMAEFNQGAGTAFRGTREDFLVWGDPEIPYDPGPPWVEPSAFAMAGWATGGLDETIPIEYFDQMWGNDPFTTFSGAIQWIPLTAPDGELKGHALTFPVTIPPNKNELYIYVRSAPARLAEIAIPPGTYETATALAMAIDSVWMLYRGTTRLEWNTWSDATGSGLTFGWNGLSGVASGSAAFVGRVDRAENDARAVLGLTGLGLGGADGHVQVPASWLGTLPLGIETSEWFILDQWADVRYDAYAHPEYGTTVARAYGMQFAAFDGDLGATHQQERFLIDGWHGSGATWTSALTDGMLTFASFEGAVTRELFDPAQWPDEVLTD